MNPILCETEFWAKGFKTSMQSSYIDIQDLVVSLTILSRMDNDQKLKRKLALPVLYLWVDRDVLQAFQASRASRVPRLLCKKP